MRDQFSCVQPSGIINYLFQGDLEKALADCSENIRFDGQQWETLALEAPARSVAEINSGIVLIGVDSPSPHSGSNGLRKVTWDGKKVERMAGPEGVILDIIKLPNGQIVAASWWDLYELDAAVNISSR